MTTRTHPAPATRGRATWHFVRHYLEMVVAMLVGMVALGPLWSLAWPGLSARPDLDSLVMATNMAIGMGAWMKLRRHSWTSTLEMCAAMYAPFVVLLVPFWTGAISGDALMTAGHLLMLPAMAAAMWWRRSEYLH